MCFDYDLHIVDTNQTSPTTHELPEGFSNMPLGCVACVCVACWSLLCVGELSGGRRRQRSFFSLLSFTESERRVQWPQMADWLPFRKTKKTWVMPDIKTSPLYLNSKDIFFFLFEKINQKSEMHRICCTNVRK